jgi:excisionase family DNA binding protein
MVFSSTNVSRPPVGKPVAAKRAEPELIIVTMPQRATIQTTRPGVPAPRHMGRPISAASLSRPVPAAHPAAMPVGRPAPVPAPRAAVAFLTVAEVAALMRVSKMTVYRLVHGGELSAVRVGRSFRVPERAVHDYLRDAYTDIA